MKKGSDAEGLGIQTFMAQAVLSPSQFDRSNAAYKSCPRYQSRKNPANSIICWGFFVFLLKCRPDPVIKRSQVNGSLFNQLKPLVPRPPVDEEVRIEG